MVAGGNRGSLDLEEQELAARNAYDKIDEDGHGYILIDELGGLAASLGLPIGPEEQDEALEVLDGDASGVLDREEWTKWWLQRWKSHPGPAGGPAGEESRQEQGSSLSAARGTTDTKKAETGRNDGDNGSDDHNGVGTEERIKRLAERARRARWRAGTDIHTAAWRGDLALVQDFLEDDPELAIAADVSEFGMGYRPLHYAAYGGFVDVCEALHAAGARPSAVGDNGVTALFLAAQAGKADVVRFLLDRGADPTAQEQGSGLCAVDVATDNNNPEILALMLEKGGFQVPPPLEDPPAVTKVGPTSLQASFLPLPDASGELPVIRYKVRVEQLGIAGSCDEVPDAAATSTSEAEGTAESEGKGGAAGVDADACRGSSAHPQPHIAKIVLVPAREASSEQSAGRLEREQQQRRRKLVTVRGLKPVTTYTVQVAAINAVGFGPYGAASAAITTPSKPEEEAGEGGSRTGKEKVPSTGVHVNKKGKGRQVLAMERRRRLAAQAKQWQEQQQREAQERHARRAERGGHTGGTRVSKRQLSATSGGSGQRTAAGGGLLDTDGTQGVDGRTARQQGCSSSGGISKTQPLPRLGAQVRQQRRLDGHSSASDKGNAKGAVKLSPGLPAAEATAGNNQERHQRLQPQHPRRRTWRGDRPATTGSQEKRSHSTVEDNSDASFNGGGSSRDASALHSQRNIATAPAEAVVSGEWPRYSAVMLAGQTSARAYWRRSDDARDAASRHIASAANDGFASAGDSDSNSNGNSNNHDHRSNINRLPADASSAKKPAVANGSRASHHTAAVSRNGSPPVRGSVSGRPSQRARHEQRRRQEQHQPRRGVDVGRGEAGGSSSSEVSVSSCGDMTISSEEQDGEDTGPNG